MSRRGQLYAGLVPIQGVSIATIVVRPVLLTTCVFEVPGLGLPRLGNELLKTHCCPSPYCLLSTHSRLVPTGPWVDVTRLQGGAQLSFF